MLIFIVYGRRRSIRRLGYVADYCGTCRGIKEFKVEEVMTIPHIFFIPVGRGTFLGHVQTCTSCGSTNDAYTHRFETISKKQIASIDQLALETFPTVYEVFKMRLDREARIRTESKTFDPFERQKTFFEIFSAASHHFQRRQRRSGLRILVNGLNPLDPTEQELRDSLSHFRDGKHSIGTLRSADLLSMVQRKELSVERY